MMLRSRVRGLITLELGIAMAVMGCGGATVTNTAGPAGSAAGANATAAPNGSSAAGSPSGSPVVFGVLEALTGPHAPAGTAWLDGAEAAAKEINDAGGVLGRPVKIVSENEGGDPVDAVTVSRRMLAVDSPAVIIGLAGTAYPTALPIIAQSKMVIFADVGDPALDNQTDPYVFRAVPSDALTGTAMAWLAHHDGYHNVALVFDAAAGAQTLVPSIKAAAPQFGLTFVNSNSSDLPEQAPSYQTAVQQIIAAKPDALLLQLDPGGAGTFFQELIAQGGGNIPVIGSDSTSTAEWVKAIGATEAQKELTSVVAATGLTGTAGQQFTTLFQQLFSSPPRTLSGNNYDAAIVAALAMDAAHSTDPTVYVSYIPKVTTPGSGVTVVTTYAQGVQALNAGKIIKYTGISSPMDFNSYHAITSDYQAVKTTADGSVQVLMTIPATELETK